MKRLLVRIIRNANFVVLIALIFLLVHACQNAKKNRHANVVEEVETADKIQEATSANPDIKLKDCEINEAYMQLRFPLAPALSEQEFDALDLGRIEELNRLQHEVPVKIIDTLQSSTNQHVILVAYQTDGETAAFLVNLNNQHKTEQFEQVYYEDYVEYISNTSTRIADNKINVTVETFDENQKTTTFTKVFAYKNGLFSSAIN
ncbi:hypothetical protein [Sphingobacterium hungaricum]